MKPWYKPTEEFAQDFWMTARKTPYYENIIYIMSKKKVYREIDILAKNVSFKGKTANRAKRLYHKIVKDGGIVDSAVRKIVNK